MESIITWSLVSEPENHIVLKIKFPKGQIPTVKDMIIGKDDPEKLRQIGERLAEFYEMLFKEGFLTIGGGEVSYGKDRRTSLRVEIIL